MRLTLLPKFALVVGLLMLAIMALMSTFNLRALKRLSLQEAVRDVDNLGETLILTTHYHMLEDDRTRVYQMIREVGTQQGVDHIRLINKDGIISFSTDDDEIGTLLDKEAEGCGFCHSDEVPLTHASSMARSRIFRNPQGTEVLAIAKGIYNDTSCASAACHAHPPQASLLGILDITVSLEDMEKTMRTFSHDQALFTSLELLLLLGGLTVTTRLFITRPVNRLLKHTRRLTAGDLEARIENPSGDEMGELTKAFNEMTRNLKLARDELEGWAANLEARVAERTREMEEMQGKLRHTERLAALGELVAGIAHEVNNPLTGILFFASMVQNNPTLDPALKEDLQVVVRETKRCAHIVQGLLEFSRQAPPQMKNESVHRLLEDTLALVGHQVLFHNIRIRRLYDGELPEIPMDPGQMRQVFMNLVLNAGQAMPDGGTLEIATGRDTSGRFVCIRFTDTGCGISEEYLEKIFDPFFTTKEHRGTGLGLSVSYGIVNSHGGRIEVHSRSGEGTTVSVLLPLPGHGVTGTNPPLPPPDPGR